MGLFFFMVYSDGAGLSREDDAGRHTSRINQTIYQSVSAGVLQLFDLEVMCYY